MQGYALQWVVWCSVANSEQKHVANPKIALENSGIFFDLKRVGTVVV